MIYNDLKSLASDLLKDFKQGTVFYVALTPPPGPDDDPGVPTETKYELDATVTGVSSKLVDNSFVLSTDLMVICSVRDDLIPSGKDFIENDGSRYKIVQDISVPQAGTKVVWKFIVRRGA